jgi:Phage tail tube protein, GTA-gp10
MANRARGEVEVLLDGTGYTWRLTTNAACALEGRTGQKLGEVLTAADQLSMRALRDLVWVLLQDAHASEFPTADSAGDFIDRMGMLSCLLKFRELLELNQPATGGAAQQAAGNPPMAGTGDGSLLRAVG